MCRYTYACGLCACVSRTEDKFGCSLLVVISLVCLFFVRVSHETGTHAGSMLAGQLHGSSGLPLSFQIVCAITPRL